MPIDQVNNAGETAYPFAALFGRVELLLTRGAGADPNHADARGKRPWRRAAAGAPSFASAIRKRQAQNDARGVLLVHRRDWDLHLRHEFRQKFHPAEQRCEG